MTSPAITKQKRNGGRPTILQVAERAGVSRAAVSKVLRNQYGVSDALRARVETAVRELNYRPLASARALRGSGHAIGILMAEIGNPFFPSILEGVTEALDPADYQTFLGLGRFQQVQQERMIETMLDRQMDGLIMIAPSMNIDVLERFVQQIPVVVIGYARPDASGFDSVNSDDRLGTALVVEHFYDLGHRDIALLAADRPQAQEQVVGAREQAYEETMHRLGLGKRIRVCRSPLYAESVPQPVLDLLSKRDRPTAIFAVSDGYAIHVYNAAAQLGLSIPDDVAVAGYDDSWIAGIAPLSLTSVQQSGTSLGKHAVRLLMERIDGRQHPEHFVLPPKLIIRRSSGVALNR